MKPVILIVEDELIIALDMKEILEQEGYEVIINIVSVEQALIAIENHSPNLVLIDIHLKKKDDGIVIGNYLLKKDRIPFIYVTSFSDRTTLDRVNETRPYGYVVKPFKPTDLKSTISIVLNNFKHRSVDAARNQNTVADDAPFIIKKTIHYINENVLEKITSDDLTILTKWKYQHFQKMFKQYVGISPHKYILERKIERVKVMLVETTIPITQISYDVGFKSHSNFCSIFKNLVGKTPENYRKWNEAQKYL